ncbi:MAG: tetratricopeptide repeat protein [Bradyrhizobium sp.]|uniref:NfrA family protein n=1 Tax=Bradyrhizobium sp. TaxID=376 RepID=UPI0025BEA459|nr:tetratricopeptide repeat protein [Bradyrhizobium sp.]MBI5261815.1 tetratricopeptide repeat protein [Bradyrhizobium sp.]
MAFGGKHLFGSGISRAAFGGLLVAAVLCHGANAQVPDPDRPLEGEAYSAADDAYKAFNQGDYKTASARAAASVDLRPDMLRLRLLLIDALVAAGDLSRAEQATVRASETFASNQELESRLASIRQRLAQQPASEGYKALEKGDPRAAIRAARAAVEYAPDVMSYRLLLLSAQLADNNLADAAATASDTIKLDPGNYAPLVWRAYIQQRLGNRALAVVDLNAALALPGLTELEQKNIRLIAADAALASGDYRAAQKLLDPYSKTDPQVVTRLGDAEAAANHKATLKGDGKNVPMPVQDCRATPYGTVCSLEAPLVQSIATPIDKAAEGYEAAGKAYQAARAKNYSAAIEEARIAIEASPELLANRLLLLNLLMSTGRPGDAEAEATKVINQGQASGEVFAQRGFARKLQHKDRAAMADWEAALQRGLSAEQARNVRLALADAALAAKEPQRAQRALERLPTSYDTAVRKAYALQAMGRKEESLPHFKIAERLAPTGAQRDDALRAQINTLLELERKPEARALFDQAVARGQLSSMRDADLAYIAVAVGNDELALQRFDRAHARGQLPPRATIDAGYAAMRRFENPKAISYLMEGIDAKADGRLNIDDQKLFETRRTVADLARVWGINTSVSYGKVGSAPNPFLIASSPTSSYTSQLGSEFYYRPEEFGNRNGALFEVFGRVFETLYDQAGGPTGLPTTQGMVGARWKPFSDHNLVLEVDKLFRLGNAARNDTLLRAAYSYTVGTDLRVLETNWPTWYIYAEVDRFLEKTQLVGIFEGRFGRSFRLDPISSNLVFFPHAVVAASYDDSFAVHDGYSAGVGGSLRYWFGETKYMAPPSYWELTLQYRFRLAGDKRAEGIFAQTSINY